MEKITLQKHDDQWKETFLKECELLLNVLSQAIDKIHHVGSMKVLNSATIRIKTLTVQSTL